MIVIPEHNVEAQHKRSHPWTKTEYDDGAGKYYDFKAQPELIRTVLEDFVPFNGEPAIQSFYNMLQWVNRPEGVLETNDCAFRGPEPHEDVLFRKALRASGRLQFFYRAPEYNLPLDGVRWLLRMFHIYLSLERRDVDYAVFETSICPTDFVLIGQSGSRLSVRFCAYGDSQAETFAMLDVAFAGLRRAFERIDLAMSVQIPDYP